MSAPFASMEQKCILFIVFAFITQQSTGRVQFRFGVRDQKGFNKFANDIHGVDGHFGQKKEQSSRSMKISFSILLTDGKQGDIEEIHGLIG